MDKRICFVCNSELDYRAKPTRYKVEEYPRSWIPMDLYLCANCARQHRSKFENLLSDHEKDFWKRCDEENKLLEHLQMDDC